MVCQGSLILLPGRPLRMCTQRGLPVTRGDLQARLDQAASPRGPQKKTPLERGVFIVAQW